MALSIAPPKLSQATIVVGLMLAAFVLWLAANNRLIVYWNILIGRSAGSSSAGSSSSSAPANVPMGASPALTNPPPDTSGAIPSGAIPP